MEKGKTMSVIHKKETFQCQCGSSHVREYCKYYHRLKIDGKTFFGWSTYQERKDNPALNDSAVNENSGGVPCIHVPDPTRAYCADCKQFINLNDFPRLKEFYQYFDQPFQWKSWSNEQAGTRTVTSSKPKKLKEGWTIEEHAPVFHSHIEDILPHKRNEKSSISNLDFYLEKWYEETSALSSFSAMIENEYAQKIIDMGKDHNILTLLLGRMKLTNQSMFIFLLIEEIAKKHNMSTPEIQENHQGRIAQIVASTKLWGDEEGYYKLNDAEKEECIDLCNKVFG